MLGREIRKRGISYWIRGNLYLSVTNQLKSLSLVQLRGQGFQLSSSELQKLPFPHDSFSTAEEMSKIINQSYEQKLIQVDSMDSSVITFAGYGDPIFQLNEICETAQIIHEVRHGVPFRIITHGLFHHPADIANQLHEAGIEHIAISLLSDNPKQYSQIMQPTDPQNYGFSTVCNFIIACVERGLTVTCTAVERPDVDISRVRKLSEALGAQSFKTYSYHP